MQRNKKITVVLVTICEQVKERMVALEIDLKKKARHKVLVGHTPSPITSRSNRTTLQHEKENAAV